MDLASLTAKANEALSQTDFSKSIKFDFGSVGKLLLDGANGIATNEDGAADATVNVDWNDFLKLAKGNLDPTMAMMSGKLKVNGDMSALMQLQNLFSKFV